ncbi:RluA family pseudouridine synthase [Cytophagaceae bacterium ABcell3]|nr:RluA family pseudouridine synthase [Cytophagaceae bacterium ABcell3]
MVSVFKVVYEDNHLLLVNKSSGVLVQGDKTGDKPLADYIKDYIKEKYQKPGNVFTGVVHRLDRPVTGLVLLAKTSKALGRMNAQFRNREIEKTYFAIVKKQPKPEGTLLHWLVKDKNKNISKAYKKEVPGSLRSILDYKLLAEAGGYFLLEVKPHTGRPHQIRIQLASMGCPIVGDVKYGFPEPLADGSICLHARKLEFVHPVKKEPMAVEACLPDKFYWQLFEKTIK